MSQETTYLELSEVDGAHKFYEVIVDNATLTVRYGRIGDQGQIKASAYPDNARARAAAAKKIGEKVRKGYAPHGFPASDRSAPSPGGKSSAPAPPPTPLRCSGATTPALPPSASSSTGSTAWSATSTA